jgi:hypothetical protein
MFTLISLIFKEHFGPEAQNSEREFFQLHSRLQFCAPGAPMVELSGIEPLTSALQGRRSPKLSYSPSIPSQRAKAFTACNSVWWA